jgi:hypothetical protein
MPENLRHAYGQDYIDSLVKSKKIDRYKVSFGQHYAGWMNAHLRPFFKTLSTLERLTWEEELDEVEPSDPVYICGLARSGTTILLELLYGTGSFASHLYKDYPFIDIPILWNKWLNISTKEEVITQERAHFDGIMITPDSPEAFEEMLWMEFFPSCHTQSQSNVLDQSITSAEFEKYYKTHIQKILLCRSSKRYLAKGNYNLTRIGYILKLFPDAKFIIPIRDPAAHIFSLIKQHNLFLLVERGDHRAKKYMQWSGHYEFGMNRVPINVGDNEIIAKILSVWETGDEIEGWALYWNMLHEWLLQTLNSNSELSKSVKLVNYEALCDNPLTHLTDILEHCSVSLSDEKIENLSLNITKQNYIHRDLMKDDLNHIKRVTQQTYNDLISMT